MPDDALAAQQDVAELGHPELRDCTIWAARPMAEWRERGYVPDSDDEDEVNLSAASSLRPPAVPVTPQEHEFNASHEQTRSREGLRGLGATILVSGRHDELSQEIENAVAGEGRPGEEGEFLRPHSFVEDTIRNIEGENPRSNRAQVNFPGAIEADDDLPAASVGDQLQAELEYGLQSVKEILGNSYLHSRSAYADRSDTSSPLSSIRSFADDDEMLEDEGCGRPEPVRPRRGTVSEPQSSGYQNNSPPQYPGRDLRRRNPIQLHPYALEDARYQQELTARGLKPLRIGPGTSGTQQKLAADETQDPDQFSSSPMSGSAAAESFSNLDTPQYSPNGLSPVLNGVGRKLTPEAFFEDDDALPDLSAILEGEIPDLPPKKRRKVAHKSAREATQSLGHHDFHVPNLPPPDLGRTVYAEMEKDVFEVPPSPPGTGSSIVSNTLMVIGKMPESNERITTPRALPTPATSSLTKAPPEPELETEYSSNSSEDSQFNDHSIPASSPEVAGMGDGLGIQSLHRRIKGVLPASWLTLDFDQQTRKKRSMKSAAGFPVQQLGAKGVAQKLKTDRPQPYRAGDYDTPVIELSDDSSETGHSALAKTGRDWDSILFEDDEDLIGPFLHDVAEDNSIDVIAEPLPRSGKRNRLPAAMRQQTLDGRLNTSRIFDSAYTDMLQTKPKRKNQPTPRDTSESHRKHRHHKTGSVSVQSRILDAPGFAQLAVIDQPQFLKIAARRARTRRDKTQRPLSEYQVNLHTTDLPNPSTKTKPTTNNNADQLASLKTSTAATIHRVLSRQVNITTPVTPDDKRRSHFSGAHTDNRTRGTLGNFVRHLDHSTTATLPRRLLLHYQNRSGAGHLASSLTRARGPRSAQVEATQSHPRDPLKQSLHQRSAVANTVPARHRRKRAPQYREKASKSLDQPLFQCSSRANDCATILEMGEMRSLLKGTFYHETTFIGSGGLARTIKQILQRPRNFDVSTGRTDNFIHPETDDTHIWGAWDPTMSSQFKNDFKTVLEHSVWAGTVPRLIFNLRTIIRYINYINDVLYFEDSAARASFVTTCVEILLSVVIATQGDETTLSEDLEDDMLHLLNHVAVFSFQVSHIASTPVIEHALQMRAWNLFDTIMRRTLSFALGSRGLLKLVEYLKSNRIPSVREKGIRMEDPEIDALVIVPHLCRSKKSGESCSSMLSKILTAKVDDYDADNTFGRLGEVMTFIWTLTPFSSIDASGCLSSSVSITDEYSCWPVIVPVLQAFLKSRIHSQDATAPHNVIGRRYINFCLHLAITWGWFECAGLVQLLCSHYASNNMDALFAEKEADGRDFLDYYAEHRRIQLHSDNDSGFDSFLKLVIVSGRQKACHDKQAARLSSFIFSLVPNSGQLMRKAQAHERRVLKPLRNRHDLYTALYFVSPIETKTRLLQQIQGLVDFSESHLKACAIARRNVFRLTRFQISPDEDPVMLHSFAIVIQEMVRKMEAQFDEARTEPLKEVDEGLLGREVRDDVLRITRHNQDLIQNLLTRILRAWSNCIRICRTAQQARCLVLGDDLAAVMQLCTRTMSINAVEGHDLVAFRDEVIKALLFVFAAYIVFWVPKSENLRVCFEEVQRPLKDVLSSQLGRSDQCSDEVLRLLTSLWHTLARTSVDGGLKSWHNYLSQGGCDTWQSFDDTWHKRQYEILFAALFVESLGTQLSGTRTEDVTGSAQDHFVHGQASQHTWREWQVPMLQLWINSLLVPEARFKFQGDLTTAILRFDAAWNPLMFHLPLLMYRDGVLVKIGLDELISFRTALVLALLRNMNKLTKMPDSQDAIFGPNADECSAILKSMLSLMKQYLAELEQNPPEQAIYADFVSRVLFEMRIYTTHLEPVPDDFEYILGRFLTPPGAIMAKLSLYKQEMVDKEMEKHMVVYFHTTAERAAISGQQEVFKEQLVSVFIDLDHESLKDVEGDEADSHFLALFLQNVFPAYLDRMLHGSGFIIARPILGCILTIYTDLHFRYGYWTKQNVEPFVTATLSLLATLKNTFASSKTSPERILSDPRQLHAYGLLCSILSEMLCRCQEMQGSFGSFDVLFDVWEYFLFFYKYTLMVAFRPPCALPEELSYDDIEILLVEPDLSATDAAMLAYSKRELGDMLDLKWVPGHAGTWFVHSPGGRREQVLGSGAIGTWEQEMSNMAFAATRFVRCFARLWNE